MVQCLGQPALADVIGPALGQHYRKLIRQDGLEKGDVLVGNLFLEIDGIGGDDDRLFGGQGLVDSRDEVGECLADAGAGFDNQVLVFIYGLADALEHGHLLGPVFVGREFLGQQALGPEYGLGVKHKLISVSHRLHRLIKRNTNT